MFNYIVDSSKSIFSVNTSTVSGKHFLKWQSSGLSKFLILYGDNSNSVNLCFEERREVFSSLFLNDTFSELLTSKNVWFKKERIQVMLFSHDELKRDGGLIIKENPGVFAIYGFEYDGVQSPIVYIEKIPEYAQNMLTKHVDIVIEDSAHYIEKRTLFKKNIVYSGYHAIVLTKPYPGLIGGVLKYRIADYCFPFPDDIVKNGGTFYVKAEEKIGLEFVTSNPGIRIK